MTVLFKTDEKHFLKHRSEILLEIKKKLEYVRA